MVVAEPSLMIPLAKFMVGVVLPLNVMTVFPAAPPLIAPPSTSEAPATARLFLNV